MALVSAVLYTLKTRSGATQFLLKASEARRQGRKPYFIHPVWGDDAQDLADECMNDPRIRSRLEHTPIKPNTDTSRRCMGWKIKETTRKDIEQFEKAYKKAKITWIREAPQRKKMRETLGLT